MSNSSLVNYIKISPHKNVMSNKTNRKITIHHMAGNLSVETCGNAFSGNRKCSANYGIGTDGRVGLYVDEKDRSWCSSSYDNDCQAVTIEVANCGGEPNWPVSDKAYNKLIDLCVDICKRNSIPKLVWTGDASGTLTCHYMFAATACPGPYLKARMGQIANAVNARLGSSSDSTHKTSGGFKEGDVIKLKEGTTYYNGKKIPAWVFNKTLYYRGTNVNGVAFSTQKTGPITGVVKESSIVGGGSTGKSIDELAREVIRGDWGNGSDRKRRLEDAGYDYYAVQNRVKELFG